jgi:hypothetical protein
VVTSIEQLRRLPAARSPVVPGRRVHLELAELDDRERARWEARLSRWAGACGCKSGAAALLVFAAWFTFAALTGRLGLSLLSPLLFVAGCVGAALLGKLLGIAIGRLALHVSVGRLCRLLDDGRPPGRQAPAELS